MTCEEARRQMMDELGHASTPALRAHVQSCAACAADWANLQSGFAALDHAAIQRAPPLVAENVRKRILAKLVPRARLIRGLPFDGLLSIVFGSAAAFASLLLLHSRGLLAGAGPLRLAAGAILWAGVFILTFWTLLRKWGVDPQFGHLVLGALSAAGLFLAGNHLLPLPAAVHWCSTRLGASLGPVFFAMGTVYAAIPLLLFATSASRRWHLRPRRVLLAGGFFFMLVAPAIFLQCSYFTAGALFAWLLGAVAGSFGASAAGYWLGTRASAQT
jgi:hypothetical protein